MYAPPFPRVASRFLGANYVLAAAMSLSGVRFNSIEIAVATSGLSPWAHERTEGRARRRRSGYCVAAEAEAAAPEHLNRDRLATLAASQIP
ncbi:unnamed protein product, partial [Iphiclides podalirius]